MASMTKAQARKRLSECKSKFNAVYFASQIDARYYNAITDKDFIEMKKILDRCLKKLM
jgi:hypothetical protein